MSPIAPGTLCLLVGDNRFAGRTCTVVTCHGLAFNCDSRRVMGGVYEISVPGVCQPAWADFWGVLRHQLVPLTPPPLDDAVPRAIERPREVTA